MTAEGDRVKSRSGEEKKQEIPNLVEAWKKIYFESEDALARAIDDYVAGQSFTDFLEQMGSQYLSMYKSSTQNMDRFFANNPVPTKKDIARVAELVVSVEEKVDNFDSEISANMNTLAVNLIKLVDFQTVMKDELIALRQDIQSLQKHMLTLNEKIDQKPVPAPKDNSAQVPVRRRTKEKQGEVLKEEGKLILPASDAPPPSAEAPVRAGNRSKPTGNKKG